MPLNSKNWQCVDTEFKKEATKVMVVTYTNLNRFLSDMTVSL